MSLRSNYVMLLNELNLDSVLPVMLAENLVSPEEYRVIQESSGHSTERERRDKILMALPRKGRDFYTLFCKCIVWSGQVELAQKMGFDVSTVEDPTKYGANQPSPQPLPQSHSVNAPPTNYPHPLYSGISTLQGHTRIQTPTTPPNYPLSATPSPAIVSPAFQPRLPSVTSNVLVLYCKDRLLQVSPELPQEYRRTPEQYCQEVSDFVETLTNLSSQYNDRGEVYQAYQFIYDRNTLDGVHVDNTLLWSDSVIASCDFILLLCSPQLITILNTSTESVVEMEQAMFNKHSLVGVCTTKTVIPVFLNMGRKQPHWVPQPLQFANSYLANVRTLQEGCEGVVNEEEWSTRVSQLFQDDVRLEELVKLWKVLRKDPPSLPMGHFPPVPVPHDGFREKLHKLAPDVNFIWQELATRLGVSFDIQQTIQRKPVDITQKTRDMFDEWRQNKGQGANKEALIQALKACKCTAVADKVQKNF